MTDHVGVAGVASPLDPSALRGLFAQQFENKTAYRIAEMVAPRITVEEMEAQGMTLDTWMGLDLSGGIDYTEEIDENAPLPLTTLSLGQINFETSRYPIGKFKVQQRAEAAYLARADVSLRDAAMRVHAARGRALYAYLVNTAITTTGNYASGFEADPGNYSGATADWIGLFRARRQLLNSVNRWSAEDAYCVIAEDVAETILASDQFAASPIGGRVVGNLQVPELVPAWVGSILGIPPARVMVQDGTYKDSSGTVTDLMTASFVLGIAATDLSFARTVTPDDGEIVDLRVDDFVDQETKGIWHYADLNAKINIGTNNAATLAHGLLA